MGTAPDHRRSDADRVRAVPARPGLASPAPWPAFAAVALTAAMTFFVLRRLVSPFWGLMAGLVLAFHPYASYAWRWAPPFDQAMWAQALTAVVLACVVEGGRLAFLPRVAIAGWAALLVLLTVAIGLCWLILPAAGVVGVLLTGLTLPVFAGLAAQQRRRPGLTVLPSYWNIFAALVVGLLAVSAVTLLAPVAEPYVGEVIRTRLTPGMTPWETLGMPGWRLPGLTPDELRQWCWPCMDGGAAAHGLGRVVYVVARLEAVGASAAAAGLGVDAVCGVRAGGGGAARGAVA